MIQWPHPHGLTLPCGHLRRRPLLLDQGRLVVIGHHIHQHRPDPRAIVIPVDTGMAAVITIVGVTVTTTATVVVAVAAVAGVAVAEGAEVVTIITEAIIIITRLTTQEADSKEAMIKGRLLCQ